MAMQKMVRWAVMGLLLAVCLMASQGDGAPGEMRTELGTAASTTSDTSDGSSPEGVATAPATAEGRARRSTSAGAEGEESSDYNNDEPEYEDGEGDGDEEETPAGPPPTFLSVPQNLTLRPGDNATLPCRVDGLSNVAQMWLNGSRTVTVNMKILGGDRISVLPDRSLFIENVGPEDTGAYTCQITSDPIANLTHYLRVPVPAKITGHSQKQVLVSGTTLELYCNVQGSPPIRVMWTLQNKEIPNAKYNDDGSTLTIESVSKQHAGHYKCVADNGVGQPTSASVVVTVSTKPQVTVIRDMIYTGEGETIELACNVTGQPKPIFKWYKEGEEVEIGTGRFEVSAVDNTYTLRIKDLEKSDFGNYSCSAKNKFGSRQKNIIVSGTPSVPMYEGHIIENDNIILRWSVESSAPIQAHELLYRKAGAEVWDTLKPEVSASENNKYSINVAMPPLSSGQYEAYFRSQNEFGWAQSSPVTFDGLVNHEHEDNSNSDEKPAAETSKRGPEDNGSSSLVCSLTTLSSTLVCTLVFATLANHL